MCVIARKVFWGMRVGRAELCRGWDWNPTSVWPAAPCCLWGWPRMGFQWCQYQDQHLLVKARDCGTGCSSEVPWLGQYCRNPFVGRLAEPRLPVTICACQEAEPEFLFLAGKESDWGCSSVCKIKKHCKIYNLLYSLPAFHFVNSPWWK